MLYFVVGLASCWTPLKHIDIYYSTLHMTTNMILRSTARQCARMQLTRPCQRLFSTQMPLLKDKTVSKVANRTVPAEAPGADTFGQTNMLSSFSNMFDRGPNVGVEIITKKGFVLSNNVQIEQPLVLLNGSAFLWRAPEELFTNPDLNAFKIFEVASPKPGNEKDRETEARY